MATLKLTVVQMSNLLDELDKLSDGSFDIEIEVDSHTTVYAVGWLETDGYVEDDAHCGYMNGTGAWVETYRAASISLSATVFDDDGDVVGEYDIDRDQEKQVERHMNAA